MQTLTTQPNLPALYRDHFSRVAAFIHRKYPMIDCEDAAQSAYVKYWQRFPDGNCGGRDPVRVLLYLARLAAVNTIRKATRLRRCEHLRTSGDIDTITACGPIATIQDTLPADLVPIASAFVQGETYRSLYDQFGQQAVRRAVKRIRECLSN